MKKYIIGLGCSWTQGEGGYPEEIWKQYNGRVQLRGVDDYCLRHYEHENSWVNVLCRDHFPDYEPVNLGVRGIGNRAAVGQLHFCDKVDFNNSTGIIVLMLSGFERFDVFVPTITSLVVCRSRAGRRSLVYRVACVALCKSHRSMTNRKAY